MYHNISYWVFKMKGKITTLVAIGIHFCLNYLYFIIITHTIYLNDINSIDYFLSYIILNEINL